jgi:hypothetical protein
MSDAGMELNVSGSRRLFCFETPLGGVNKALMEGYLPRYRGSLRRYAQLN